MIRQQECLGWAVLGAGMALLSGGCVGAREPALVTPPMPRVIAPVEEPGPSSEERVARAKTLVREGRDGEASAAIAELPPDRRADVSRDIGRDLVRRSPSRAAEFALMLPPGAGQDDVLLHAIRGMLTQDRRGTVDWAQAREPLGAKLRARLAVARAMVEEDAPEALRWLGELPARHGRELQRLALAEWAKREPDSAIAWAQSQPDAERDELLARVGFALAQTHPSKALGLAETLPAGRERWVLLTAIAQTWIASDRAAAERWASRLPPGPDREAALEGFAAATGPVRSRAGSGGAVSRRPADAGRGLAREDTLRKELEQRLREAPVNAADWLATLPSADVTDEMLRELAREWLRRDPAEAVRWLELHVPSSARRDQILRETLP